MTKNPPEKTGFIHIVIYNVFLFDGEGNFRECFVEIIVHVLYFSFLWKNETI